MKIGILYQDGLVYRVFDSGDYAADKAKELSRLYPWFNWTWSYNEVLKTSKD
jgi:hypothetical protein